MAKEKMPPADTQAAGGAFPPVDAEAPTELPPAAPAVTATPDEWCAVLFPPNEKGRAHPDCWKHGAAAALHRWADHEHHAGKPMQLSQADYEGAIKAALSMVQVKRGSEQIPTYVPHAAALSPFARKG